MPFGFVINALSAFFLLPVCYRLLRLSYWRATRSRLPVRSHPPTRLLSILEARSERTSAVAYYRSEMNGYALCDHLSEQLFRAGGYVANFSRSVSRISGKATLNRPFICLVPLQEIRFILGTFETGKHYGHCNFTRSFTFFVSALPALANNSRNVWLAYSLERPC